MAACDEAGVPEDERSGLHRFSEGRLSALPTAAELRSLIADFGHWRLYVAGRQGDDEAADRFRRYWRRCVSAHVGGRLTADERDELASQFFERVYRAVGVEHRFGSSFRAYLKSIVVNLTRDALTRTRPKREREVALEDGPGSPVETVPAGGDSAEATLLRREKAARIRAVLGELTTSDRHVLLACLVEGRPGDEVAGGLGIQRDALYQRLHRAKKRLRQLLEREGLA